MTPSEQDYSSRGEKHPELHRKIDVIIPALGSLAAAGLAAYEAVVYSDWVSTGLWTLFSVAAGVYARSNHAQPIEAAQMAPNQTPPHIENPPQ
jgi:hypothetical protein